MRHCEENACEEWRQPSLLSTAKNPDYKKNILQTAIYNFNQYDHHCGFANMHLRDSQSLPKSSETLDQMGPRKVHTAG